MSGTEEFVITAIATAAALASTVYEAAQIKKAAAKLIRATKVAEREYERRHAESPRP